MSDFYVKLMCVCVCVCVWHAGARVCFNGFGNKWKGFIPHEMCVSFPSVAFVQCIFTC